MIMPIAIAEKGIKRHQKSPKGKGHDRKIKEKDENKVHDIH